MPSSRRREDALKLPLFFCSFRTSDRWTGLDWPELRVVVLSFSRYALSLRDGDRWTGMLMVAVLVASFIHSFIHSLELTRLLICPPASFFSTVCVCDWRFHTSTTRRDAIPVSASVPHVITRYGIRSTGRRHDDRVSRASGSSDADRDAVRPHRRRSRHGRLLDGRRAADPRNEQLRRDNTVRRDWVRPDPGAGVRVHLGPSGRTDISGSQRCGRREGHRSSGEIGE